jgi:hypothetical protein
MALLLNILKLWMFWTKQQKNQFSIEITILKDKNGVQTDGSGCYMCKQT